MRTRSPCSRKRSLTGTSLTNVPLRLSRSLILKSSPSSLTTQWRRETEGSLRQIWLADSRPIEVSSSSSANVLPFNGPAMAASLGYMFQVCFDSSCLFNIFGNRRVGQTPRQQKTKAELNRINRIIKMKKTRRLKNAERLSFHPVHPVHPV